MSNSLFEIDKILSCRMVRICFKQLLTPQWKVFVHIHNQNMHLPHWKYVLFCCPQFPLIDLPSTVSDDQN